MTSAATSTNSTKTTKGNMIQDVWHLVRTTFQEWQNDNAGRLAAALAYYTVFSIAPLLVITIAIVGFFVGPEAARGQVVGQIDQLVGRQGAEFIQGMLANAEQGSTNLLVTILGLITLLLGATGVFGELQGSLNAIWDVPPKTLTAPQAIKALIFSRLLSFGMILVIGFLLLVSLVLTTLLTAVNQWAFGAAAVAATVGQVLNFAASFLVTALLFALIYRVLPDVHVPWRDVWIGAIVTALLFSIGRLLIGLYLSRSTVTSIFGAAGSLVVVLLWVYYSAQIVFLGAEFTRVYALWREETSSSKPSRPAPARPIDATASPKSKTDVSGTADTANQLRHTNHDILRNSTARRLTAIRASAQASSRVSHDATASQAAG